MYKTSVHGGANKNANRCLMIIKAIIDQLNVKDCNDFVILAD